jgi:hypothetical protein
MAMPHQNKTAREGGPQTPAERSRAFEGTGSYTPESRSGAFRREGSGSGPDGRKRALESDVPSPTPPYKRERT